MYKRENTKRIKIGNLYIGGDNRCIIQSMCNTKTYDVESTVAQIISLQNVGCEMVRVSIPDEKSAIAIDKIKNKINIPLIADIHFDYKLALLAIERGIDKIRINPGNIGDNDNIKKVVDACKKNNVAIRIGVNGGSLSKNLLNKYNGKVTKEGLVESAIENVKLLEKFDFTDIVVSIKSSDVVNTISSYKLFAKEYNYPLHLGITESGTLKVGNIKSSVGLGILLYEGLGNTLRVSLTASPIEEIFTAKKILESLNLKTFGIQIISCPTCARTSINIEKIANEIEKMVDEKIESKINLNKIYKIAVMGCAVNGPGEAKEADIGIAGGVNEALLFKKGNIIKKIKEEQIIDILYDEILNDLYYNNI